MLNPSTADETKNDPTIERCQRRAKQLGYKGIIVSNIFAYRSTDPKQLIRQDDPIGPDNDRYIIESAKECEKTICAWGKDGKIQGRGKVVVELLRQSQIDLYYLELTKDGIPKHPLYLSYSLVPRKWQ